MINQSGLFDLNAFFTLNTHLVDVKHIKCKTFWIGMRKSFDPSKSSPGFDRCNVLPLSRWSILAEFS